MPPRDLLAEKPKPKPRDLLAQPQDDRMERFMEMFNETFQVREPEPIDTGRRAQLAGRSIAKGVTSIAAPFANPLTLTLNKLLKVAGSEFRFPTDNVAHVDRMLTQAGLAKPENAREALADSIIEGATGLAGGNVVNKAAEATLGVTRAAQNAPRVMTSARTEAGRLLEQAGVPLTRGQRSGGRFARMLDSMIAKHPWTAGRFEQFTRRQQAAFNRAVLRSIGEKADEATQEVMLSARNRIGRLFDSVGKNGVQVDDMLQSDMAAIIDDALRTVPEASRGPLLRNIDDILSAVDDTGRMSGKMLTKIRGHLSELSRNSDVGQSASALEDALLNALERTYPAQRRILRQAIDQYRNLKIIEPAIAKGFDRNISPLALSNAVASARNRAMSIYGQGGDQGLVKMAQAGRTVLPDVIPDSGTATRSMFNAPLRATTTAPLYGRGLALALRQPLPPGGGVRFPPVAAGIGLAEVLNGLRR